MKKLINKYKGVLIVLMLLLCVLFVAWRVRGTSVGQRFSADQQLLLVKGGRVIVHEPASKYRPCVHEVVELYPEAGKSGCACVQKSPFKRIADFYYAAENDKTVILLHGFGCNRDQIKFLRYIFEGCNTLILDFRAHGALSEQQCCTLGRDEIFDVKAAVDFIRSREEFRDKPLFCYGFSMGAVAGINAQATFGHLFDYGVFDCPFDSSQGLLARSINELELNLFGYTFPLPGRNFLKKYAYNPHVQYVIKLALKAVAQVDVSQINMRVVPVDTVLAAQKITIPSLFITCVNDKTKAPPAVVEEIAQAVHAPTRCLITGGSGHFDSYFHDPDKYRYKVRRFIDKCLSGEFEPARMKKTKRPWKKVTRDPDAMPANCGHTI